MVVPSPDDKCPHLLYMQFEMIYDFPMNGILLAIKSFKDELSIEYRNKYNMYDSSDPQQGSSCKHYITSQCMNLSELLIQKVEDSFINYLKYQRISKATAYVHIIFLPISLPVYLFYSSTLCSHTFYNLHDYVSFHLYLHI